MADLLEAARNDWKRFTSGEFSTELTFETPDGETASIVKGIAAKHHLGIDLDSGNYVNTKNVHCTVSESLLVASGYPVRDSDNEVAMSKHRVSYTDSAGNLRKYIVQEFMPDEMVGVITFILGKFKDV